MLAQIQIQPQIRRAPGLSLTATELALLERAFAGCPEIFIESEFRSGYSGASVLLVSPGPGQAYAVVKLGTPADLWREYQAYRQFVEPAAPQNTARLYGEPLIAAEEQVALLRYTFAGGNPRQPTGNLQTYYNCRGGQATAMTLDRIFRVYGRQWWTINRPAKFALGEYYDRLLPVHLYLKPAPAGEKPVRILRAENLTTALDELRPGQMVRLQGCRIARVRPDQGVVTLIASPPPDEAAAAIRLRLVTPAATAYRPGELVDSLEVVVTATRSTTLAKTAQLVLEYTAAMPAFDPEAAHFSLAGVIYPNPLIDLSDLLSRFIETRISTIHGDLNLQNILVDEVTGFAWLIDFVETGSGPTLYDLQWLEGQIVTRLLPATVEQAGLGPEAAAQLLMALHADTPLPTAPHPALQEPYTLLMGLHRLARQYLMDDQEWDEYYLGLIVALLGTLKFPDLPPLAHGLAFVGAAAVRSLLEQPLAAAPSNGSITYPRTPLPQRTAVRVEAEIPKGTAIALRPSWGWLLKLGGVLLGLMGLLWLWLNLTSWLNPAPPPLALIVDVQGQVEVRRRGSDRLIPAAFGLELFWEDAVITYEGSSATLMCENGSILHLGDYESLIVRCDESNTQGIIGSLPPNLIPQFSLTYEARPVSLSAHDLAIAEQTLRASPLNFRAQSFLRAKLYANNGLPQKAIAELEQLASQSQHSGLTQVMGDVYLQAGMLVQASAAYTSALREASMSADLNGQAQAYVGLGRVAQINGETDVAAAHWRQAINLYHQAGNRIQAEQVVRLLRSTSIGSNWLNLSGSTLGLGLLIILVCMAAGLGMYWRREKGQEARHELGELNAKEYPGTWWRQAWSRGWALVKSHLYLSPYYLKTATVQLLEPQDGATQSGNRLELAWGWNGTLGPDDYFQVEIWNRDNAASPGVDELTSLVDMIWVKDKFYHHDYPSNRNYVWRIVVVRGTPAGEKTGNASAYRVWEPGDEFMLVSAPSETRTFYIKGATTGH